MAQVQYQYTDDTQLYISTPGQADDAVAVLPKCLKTWMGMKQHYPNPDKIERL